MTGMDQRHCEQIADLIDFYIDRELPATQMDTVAEHLAVCAQCKAEAEDMVAFRIRLRGAARSVPVPEAMVGRMMANVHRDTAAGFRRPGFMAIAAAAVFTIAVAGYELRQLQSRAAAQDEFVARVGREAVPVVRVGLNDHVHCAVFRKFPASAPSLPEMAATLGPEFADLLPVLERNTPVGTQVVMAHKCRFLGRLYVHLVARDEKRLISLIVTAREDGEAFEGNLREVVRESGGPLYSAGVPEFSVAGFETAKHLVYLISDTERMQNLQMLQAMAAGLRDVLRKAEG